MQKMKYKVLLNKVEVQNIVSVDMVNNKVTYIDDNSHFPYMPCTIQCEPGELTLEPVNEQN